MAWIINSGRGPGSLIVVGIFITNRNVGRDIIDYNGNVGRGYYLDEATNLFAS